MNCDEGASLSLVESLACETSVSVPQSWAIPPLRCVEFGEPEESHVMPLHYLPLPVVSFSFIGTIIDSEGTVINFLKRRRQVNLSRL